MSDLNLPNPPELAAPVPGPPPPKQRCLHPPVTGTPGAGGQNMTIGRHIGRMDVFCSGQRRSLCNVLSKRNHHRPDTPHTPSGGHRYGRRQHTVCPFALETQSLSHDFKQGVHDCCIRHRRSRGIRWRPEGKMLPHSIPLPSYFPKASKLGHPTSPMGKARVGNDIGDLARNWARTRGRLEVLVHAGRICQMGG